MPSPDISNSVVEPYNFVLAFSQLIEDTDLAVIMDNQAMYKICENKLDVM